MPVKAGTWTAGMLVVALLAGCTLAPERSTPDYAYGPGTKTDTNAESLKKKLYAQYGRWKGTRYKLGGFTRNGIDCSGFVYVTFESLGVALPRTTESQARLGASVGKSQLRTGDLVFFKTSIWVSHVGIYLEHGKFLHASTNRGITISDLDEDYWKSAYWKAKRIAAL